MNMFILTGSSMEWQEIFCVSENKALLEKEMERLTLYRKELVKDREAHNKRMVEVNKQLLSDNFTSLLSKEIRNGYFDSGWSRWEIVDYIASNNLDYKLTFIPDGWVGDFPRNGEYYSTPYHDYLAISEVRVLS